MEKVHIKVQLPSEYGVLHVIKRVNYPFNQSSQQFMLAVIRLADREQLDAYSVFGRIGHALANDTPMDWVTDDEALVRVDYKESNPRIIEFYRNSPMTNKQITTMFLRLMVRLCHTHGPHLADLVYLIDTLPARDAVPVEFVTQPSTPIRPHYAPKTTQPKSEGVENADSTVDTTVDTTTDSVPSAPTGIKRRKPKPKPKPELKPEPKPEPELEPKPEPEPERESVEVVEPQEDFLSRAEKVKAKAQEALEDDATVQQNPLLRDFYEF